MIYCIRLLSVLNHLHVYLQWNEHRRCFHISLSELTELNNEWSVKRCSLFTKWGDFNYARFYDHTSRLPRVLNTLVIWIQVYTCLGGYKFAYISYYSFTFMRPFIIYGMGTASLGGGGIFLDQTWGIIIFLWHHLEWGQICFTHLAELLAGHGIYI